MVELNRHLIAHGVHARMRPERQPWGEPPLIAPTPCSRAVRTRDSWWALLRDLIRKWRKR